MKNKNILFSIIIPVYNVEKYILKCLNSVLDAIQDDCEVIIVNDGSTDNCEKIINDFLNNLQKEKRENFKYVYKKNKGLADTKNVGIAMSSGKYISVVDSDDYITEDFYDTARRYTKDDYDLIIYDLYVNFENNSKDNYIARAIREDIDDSFFNKIMMGAMLGSSCNKIIKRELYKYQFPVSKQYEDVAVTPFILCDAKKIKYVPHPNYIYLQRQKSIVSSNTLDGAFYKICNNISDVLHNVGEYEKYNEIIYVFFLDRTIDMLSLSWKNNKRKFIANLKDFYDYNKDVINYIIDSGIIDLKKQSFTKNQFKIVNLIYISLYNQKFLKVKRIIIVRNLLNWIRSILSSIKNVFKVLFGGING